MAVRHAAGTIANVFISKRFPAFGENGFVRCGGVGAITAIGTIFQKETLLQVELSRRAAASDVGADIRARELEAALAVIASFDAGVDLVLYYKHLMVLKGYEEYRLNINETDELSPSQARVIADCM